MAALIEQGDVKFTYKHMIVVNPVRSQWAAEAAECAAEQGKFWTYHDILLKNQKLGFTKEILKNYGKQIAVDTKQFNQCVDSSKYEQKVKDQSQQGKDLGLPGTPSFIVNGKVVNWQSFDDVVKAIKEAASK